MCQRAIKHQHNNCTILILALFQILSPVTGTDSGYRKSYTGDSLYVKVQGTRQNTSELSVVWDSQFAMSFTLYMYTDCLDHRDYNLHVHLFGNDVLEFKYPLTELFISDNNFEKTVTETKECWWLLISKNAVKQCSITKVTKATLCTLWV